MQKNNSSAAPKPANPKAAGACTPYEDSPALKTLLKNVFGGVEVCKYDADFTIKYLNPGFFDMLGYRQEEELLNTPHILLVFPADRDSLKCEISRQLQGQKHFSLEYRMLRKDGGIIWVLDRGQLVTHQNGETDVQCTLTDITAQKKIEERLRFSEKCYEIALQISGITMFEYDIRTKTLILYEEEAVLFQLPRVVPNGMEALIKRGVVQPASVAVFREMYAKIHSGAKSASCSVLSRDPQGGLYNFELNLTTVFDSDGLPVRAVGVRKNIDELLSLKREQEFGRTLTSDLSLSVEANVSTDQVEWQNPALMQELGMNRLIPFSALVLRVAQKLVAPEDRQDFIRRLSVQNISKLSDNGEKLLRFSYRRRCGGQGYYWHEISASVIRTQRTGDIHARYYIKNIHEEKMRFEKELAAQQKEEQALKYIAAHDAMTNVLNKSATEQQITAYLESPQGRDGRHALMIIDIDDFKQINDNFGHLFGDGVIQEIAVRIRVLFREDDIVGRIGGDEFCVFMKNIGNRGDVGARAAKICQQTNERYEKNGKYCQVTTSVGVALYKQNGADYQSLCLHADTALYRAKGQGKNRCEF